MCRACRICFSWEVIMSMNVRASATGVWCGGVCVCVYMGDVNRLQMCLGGVCECSFMSAATQNFAQTD